MPLWSYSSCPAPHIHRNVRPTRRTLSSPVHELTHFFLFNPPLVRPWKSYSSSPGSSSASWSSGSSSPPLSDDNNNNIMNTNNNRNRTASLSTSDEGIVMDLMPKKVSATWPLFSVTLDRSHRERSPSQNVIMFTRQAMMMIIISWGGCRSIDRDWNILDPIIRLWFSWPIDQIILTSVSGGD